MCAAAEDRVAICMATYNGSQFLEGQIESIRAQTFENWALFVRDDGSTDGTLSLLKKYTEIDGRIRLIDDEGPTGVGAAANFGKSLLWINGCHAFNYYMFCDQDDVWLPEKIEMSLRKIKEMETEFPGPTLIHTDLMVVDKELRETASSFVRERKLKPDYTDLAHLLVQNNVTGCTMMWNQGLNELLIFPSDSIAMHDWWVALVASAFGRIGYIDKSTIMYRQHGGNVLGAKKVGSVSYVYDKLRNVAGVKEVVSASFKQARSFLDVYEDRLSSDSLSCVKRYVILESAGKINRMTSLVAGGYIRQGLIQAIGGILFI